EGRRPGGGGRQGRGHEPRPQGGGPEPRREDGGDVVRRRGVGAGGGLDRPDRRGPGPDRGRRVRAGQWGVLGPPPPGPEGPGQALTGNRPGSTPLVVSTPDHRVAPVGAPVAYLFAVSPRFAASGEYVGSAASHVTSPDGP